MSMDSMRGSGQSPAIAAVVTAAGFSSRMSALKALYPVGDELMIERTVRTLYEGGIRRIHVVTGYRKELLERVLKKLQQQSAQSAPAARPGPEIRIVDNPDYAQGMFTSVIAGVRSLQHNPAPAAGFLMLPVDCPFVRPRTIAGLVEAFGAAGSPGADGADIISPVFGGRAGHPPVIRDTVYAAILSADSTAPSFRGLQTVLSSPCFTTRTVETGDSGILDDIDDDKAYRLLLNKHTGIELRYPDDEERGRILADKNPGGDTVAHMEKTAELAVDIAERLNSHGLRLNPGLLNAAALLHDVCRAEPHHAAAAADYLSGLGYPEVGSIVAQHMNISRAESDEIDEAAVLYLADKKLEGERLMKLEDRMNAKLKLYADNPEAQRNIRRRFDAAFMIEKKIGSILRLN